MQQEVAWLLLINILTFMALLWHTALDSQPVLLCITVLELGLNDQSAAIYAKFMMHCSFIIAVGILHNNIPSKSNNPKEATFA